MTKFKGTDKFDHDTDKGCTGILITNLGTPDAPTAGAVRTYLAEFLSDPRVVEIPRIIWLIILHGIILRLRPPRVAAAYRKVWTEEGSPLLAISKQQKRLLEKTIQSEFEGEVKVELAMRYGNPSISSAMEKLKSYGARRVLVMPLYPQYSATTTASTFDAIFDELKTWRWVPELRLVQHYHDDSSYIGAIANSINEYQQQNGHPEKLLFSFHGLPQRNLDLGDPYYCECQKTARLISEKLYLDKEQWAISFQSRFGKAEWLKPYTDKLLMKWGKEGIKSVQVCCPGFSADCLETLEEIQVENRDYFLETGGEKFEYIPALNDRPDHIKMMVNIITKHAGNWLRI